MFYIVYKIENKLNKKYYIGCHKTKNPLDNYMGSGCAIKRAIKKYGVENFSKEILKTFKNSKAMYAYEGKLVTEKTIKDPQSYNLRLGGDGGFEHINNNVEFRVQKNKRAWEIMNNKHADKVQSWRKKGLLLAAKGSLLANRRYKEELGKWKADGCPKNSSFKPKTHSREARMKIALASTINNSQKGTCWIYNTLENKKIPKESLDIYLNDGWNKGRKMALS